MSFRARFLAAALGVCLLGGATHAQAPRLDFRQGDVFASVGFGLVMIYGSDPVTGNFHVTTFAGGGVNGGIVRFARNYDPLIHGAPVAIATGGSAPESIVFDSAGNFYVGHARLPDDDIVRLAPGGALLASFNAQTEGFGSEQDVLNPHGTDWIDLAADQRTLFYTSEGRRILRFDVQANLQLPDFAVLPEEVGQCGVPLGRRDATLFAVRVLPDGGALVADNIDIKRLNASGQIVQRYDLPDHDCWFSLNFHPDGTSFWSGDTHTGQIHRFSLAGGAPLDTVSTGFADTLFGVAVFGEVTEGQKPPVRCEATTLTPASVTVPDCGPITLTGQLRCDGNPVAGRTVVFTLNGSPVGQALTDASGAATLADVPFPANLDPGTFAGAIAASFAGDDNYAPAAGTANLTVTPSACTPPAAARPGRRSRLRTEGPPQARLGSSRQAAPWQGRRQAGRGSGSRQAGNGQGPRQGVRQPGPRQGGDG